MKKIFFIFGAILLVAAGCGSKSATTQQPTQSEQQPAAQNSQQAKPTSSVKVNNADDAVNALEKNSNNEQAMVSASDDSDLTATDSTDLDSATEVPNGN